MIKSFIAAAAAAPLFAGAAMAGPYVNVKRTLVGLDRTTLVRRQTLT